MLIKGLDVALLDYKDEPIKDPEKPTEPLTPRKVICRALIGATPQDAPVDVKVEASNLARDIYKAEADIDLDPKQVVLIRELVGKAYGTVVVGPMDALTK